MRLLQPPAAMVLLVVAPALQADTQGAPDQPLGHQDINQLRSSGGALWWVPGYL
jgi:hypothetical protein